MTTYRATSRKVAGSIFRCFHWEVYETFYFCGFYDNIPRYKPEGRGFDFPMFSLEFFIDMFLPAAL